MSHPVVEQLIVSSKALIAALDAHDIEAIETALPIFGDSVQALKSPGGWQPSPGDAPRLAVAMKLADAARARVHYLADRTRQRIDLLAVAAGRFDATPATYSRPR